MLQTELTVKSDFYLSAFVSVYTYLLLTVKQCAVFCNVYFHLPNNTHDVDLLNAQKLDLQYCQPVKFPAHLQNVSCAISVQKVNKLQHMSFFTLLFQFF